MRRRDISDIGVFAAMVLTLVVALGTAEQDRGPGWWVAVIGAPLVLAGIAVARLRRCREHPRKGE